MNHRNVGLPHFFLSICASCILGCGSESTPNAAATGGVAGGVAGAGAGGTSSAGMGGAGAATGGATLSGGATPVASGGQTSSQGGASGGAVARGGAGNSAGTSSAGDTGESGAAGDSSSRGGSSSGGSGGAPATGCTDFSEPASSGKIESSGLDGPSGIAASRRHAGVLYGQLDAGGKAVIYAMTQAGKALAEYTLMGVDNTDWEDLAVGPGPGEGSYIYVADIGDNAARTGGTPREQIQVLRVAEPEIEATQALEQRTLSDVQVLRFTYPDKPHDAEGLMVDPVTRDLLIASKESDGTCVIFRAPANTPADTPSVLEPLATIRIAAQGSQAVQVSAADASPSGDRFALRTYGNVLIWARAATLPATFSTAPKTLPGDPGPQSEGLTFSSDGNSLISAGERERTLYQSKATCP